MRVELWPGSVYVKANASSTYTTAASSYGIQNELNQIYFTASGVNGVNWKNYYVVQGGTSYISSKIWGPTGADITTGLGQYNSYRTLGLFPDGSQLLGPKFFSGSAATASAIATETAGTLGGTVNGDFYFSTV